jgi:hypothetical protein
MGWKEAIYTYPSSIVYEIHGHNRELEGFHPGKKRGLNGIFPLLFYASNVLSFRKTFSINTSGIYKILQSKGQFNEIGLRLGSRTIFPYKK